MIVLIAIIAAGLGVWREFWSPRSVWRRAIHAPRIDRVEYTNSWGHEHDNPQHVYEWSIAWPISNLRINGLDEAESLKELAIATADSDVSIRREVYRLIADRPPTDPSVGIRLLAPGLGDRDEIVRVLAIRGLGIHVWSHDSFPDEFFGMLDDPSPLVRRYVVNPICTAIARAPDSARSNGDRLIPAVLSHLDDPDISVQAATIEAIESLLAQAPRLADPGTMGGGRRVILDALQAKLDHPSRGIRAMVAFVLASYGRGLEAVPMLIELANHPHGPMENHNGPPAVSWGHRWPVRSLALLADRSDEAASYLIGRLSIIDTGTPGAAWRSLVEIAERNPEARFRIERLAIQGLDTRSTFVRSQLALVLQEIGSHHDVLPELVDGAIHEHYLMRPELIRALKARPDFDSRVLPLLKDAPRKDPIRNRVDWVDKVIKEIEAVPTLPVAHAQR